MPVGHRQMIANLAASGTHRPAARHRQAPGVRLPPGASREAFPMGLPSAIRQTTHLADPAAGRPRSMLWVLRQGQSTSQ